MIEAFVVESSQDRAALELAPLNADFFVATIRCRGLSATARVSRFLSQGLGRLFSEMATDWQGWSGPKGWRTLEGELAIEATSDPTGHVALRVRLADGAPPVWDAWIVISLEAGSLERLATKARSFEQAHISDAGAEPEPNDPGSSDRR